MTQPLIPAELVTRFLPDIARAAALGPVLDLACGSGRNGLAVLDCGAEVVFLDRDVQALDALGERLAARAGDAPGTGRLREVDLEPDTHTDTGGLPPATLGEACFGAILVFRYLHRPLFDALRRAVAPGGLILYETFTRDQPQFGRPTNPDFLLQPGELAERFEGFETLHAFEGVVAGTQPGTQQAIAQRVVRRPHRS